MRSGAIDGLSIGFKTIKAKADGGGIRHIHEADLWEISVVTFPMLPSARVGQVKSLPADAMPDKDYSNQHRLLWNIKANEVLIEALKRSPQNDYNCRWLARLREENAELKSHSTLYEPFQIWYRKYNPDQPRVSAGNPDGGQWTDSGGGGASGKPLTQEAFDRRAREKPEGTAARGGRFGAALPAKKPDTGPKAPDGTPVKLVQDKGDSKRYSVDLDEEEVPIGIGHTKSRHIAQSDESLKARMRGDYSRRETPRYTVTKWSEAYGSFENQAKANDMVNKVLENNQAIVDAVASGERNEATLNMRFEHPTGREVYQATGDSRPYVRTTFNVFVYIRHDNRIGRGYRVRTAYPNNRKLPGDDQ
ncbi:HK97 family phage prohead protease [Phyllobacterium bourgognense]|uniref:HK97 family phage prohead protease n=2 Tax=Phyllobacterium bourgognense TaxID=314236 RepID=A0A368YIW6_9HYPH|nr:HK97 family phage prohead protease [Phyllobacterium bourgognense]